MRYNEPKDQSAARLRMAVQKMGRHDAALNPLTYVVWYEHLAGINQRLTHALEVRLKQSPRLDDKAFHDLYGRYVAAGMAAWVLGDDATSLVASADAALYRSKENGPDRAMVA